MSICREIRQNILSIKNECYGKEEKSENKKELWDINLLILK